MRRLLAPALVGFLGWTLATLPVATARTVAPDQAAGQVPGTGTVSGVVTTDDTPPVPVRRATVRIVAEGAPARLVGTDDDGRFLFVGVPAGSYTVSVSKPGFVTVFHGAARPGAGPGVPIAVAAGAHPRLTLAIPRGAAVSGSVLTPLGAPAPQIEVAAIAVTEPGGVTRATTDDRGIYRIAGLPAGEYLVSAVPRIMLPGRGRGDQVVQVTDADVRWAQALLANRSRAAPSVVPEPPPGRTAGYAPVYFPGVTDATLAATLTLAAAEERSAVDLPLVIVSLVGFTGTLVDDAGDPVTSATVTLHPRTGDRPSMVDRLVTSGLVSPLRASVTDDGFTFTGVAPGSYTIVARTGAGRRGTAAPTPVPTTLWHVDDIFVDSDRTGVQLRLLPGLRLSGTVRLDSPDASLPLGATDLTLAPAGPLTAGATLPRVSIGTDATFQFAGIAPGRYVVRAAATGGAWVLRSAMLDGRDLADQPFDARPGERIDGIRVTFTSRAAEIGGRLIDASGRPVTRYSIVVCTTDRALWMPGARRIRSVRPATDGSFAVAGLPPGTYAMAAVEDLDPGYLSDPGFLTRLVESAYVVTIAEGERKRQDMRVGGGP